MALTTGTTLGVYEGGSGVELVECSPTKAHSYQLAIGNRLGPYEVTEPIGAGGRGPAFEFPTRV